MVQKRVCDECGADAVFTISGMTGRVLIDGKDNNLQGADFCEDHQPLDGEHQPHNCKRVRFHWPGMPAWNNKDNISEVSLNTNNSNDNLGGISIESFLMDNPTLLTRPLRYNKSGDYYGQPHTDIWGIPYPSK